MSRDLKLITYIYSVRIYTALITIILIPFLIRKIGIEAYGLIGFFTVFQACLGILDAGIGGVLTREAIVSKNNRNSFEHFEYLYKKIIIIFFGLAVVLSTLGYALSFNFSNKWFKTDLNASVVITSMTLMFIIFSLRYVQGPFRSLLLANESQISITTINFIGITISQPFALILMSILDGGVVFYFVMQLISSLVTCLLTIIYSEYIKKKIRNKLNLLPYLDDVCKKPSLSRFINLALQLSTLTILWVLVNQSDKLALTKYLSLSEYGIYSIAVSVISLLSILSDPLNQFLQPRLTNFYHQKNSVDYSSIYFNSFDFILVLTLPFCGFMFFFSEKIIFLWSNDIELAQNVSKYLPWLFLGGVFAVYSNFIFLLLYSFNKLKMHTLVYALFSIVVIPLNIYIAKNYYGGGTSVFYAISSLCLFLLWGGYNLYKYFNNGLSFVCYKIILTLLIQIALYKTLSNLCFEFNYRVEELAYLLAICVLGLLIMAISIILYRKFGANCQLKEEIL